MRLIDRCHTELPFYGSRRMVTWLADEGHRVNRKRVQRLTCLQQAGAHDGDCGDISDTSEKGLESIIVASLVEQAGCCPGRLSEDYDRDSHFCVPGGRH